MLGVKGVLHPNGDVFDTDGIYRRRVDDFRTEVAKLHGLDIAQFVDGIGGVDDARVGCHEAVHVRPDLQNLCIESCSNNTGGIVRTSASKVRCLA